MDVSTVTLELSHREPRGCAGWYLHRTSPCSDGHRRIQRDAMGSLSDVDTRVLVARVRAGDQQAWVLLSDRYTNLLWSVARSMGLSLADAADAVQTTWLRLVERLDTIREPEHLGSWLVTTLRRESMVMLRRSA